MKAIIIQEPVHVQNTKIGKEVTITRKGFANKVWIKDDKGFECAWPVSWLKIIKPGVNAKP